MRKNILLLLSVGFLLLGFKCLPFKDASSPTVIDETVQLKLSQRVLLAKAFIRKHSNYNQKTAFFIDMKIKSGKNRFFVYDFDEDKIIDQGLVAHGSGSETARYGELKFSNVNNSLCTSLGKYYIGKSYLGQFGKAYKLHGLDPTNNNAFLRNVVLHQYEDVPYFEQEQPICNSFGCPMVNQKFYSRLEKIIDTSEQNILMDIYY